MKQRVINRSLHPEMLDSGQQLAAAGTRGSVRDDVRLTDGDRKRLGAKITVIAVEEPVEAEATAEAATAEAAPSSKVKSGRKSE